MTSVKTIDHIKSIIALPFMVLVVIPYVIHQPLSEFEFLEFLKNEVIWTSILGVIFLLIGLYLFIQSIILFIKIGKGTLAPWNPTQKLVVKGRYQYVRNPMILGVLCILLSETLLLQSFNIFCWFVIFFITSNFYFQFSEEPGLIKRFGKEYEEYKRNVPRWVPRKSPWNPEG